ncbi:glycosyltransferase family 2 protein [Flavobacterium alvei]|uniref:Glycosyltransferase family 2 protein n=1 Tax=Flavobacterium alvei TaxID=2080416 RepID=A0A2S5AGC5_9FLAO|nr:glycosyltransferase family A protein [Flavobacterium alvei]POY41207.1 glycosyltransferase family 2 protein [Flavobacterium alvei]
MIIAYHNTKNIIELANVSAFSVDKAKGNSIVEVLIQVAEAYPDEILIWCHQSLKGQLNISEIEQLFHHKKLLLSYNPSKIPYLNATIGYIDTSHFAGINSDVSFGTWQMSSAVGGIHSTVLLAVKYKVTFDKNFDYFLCSLAKLAMPKGLLCYSEPKLLKQKVATTLPKASAFTLFRFVKQHYKTQWVFLLLLNLFLYERKFPLLPFISSFFYRNRIKTTIDLDDIIVQSSRKVIDKATVDVIIPTIGRKDYLYDVLKDFSKQTLLPNTIIIVEQNPKEGSESELDYLTNEEWPFQIQHIFTHQAGACNARNLALNQTQSEWVFLADDDIRFGADFFEKAFEQINKSGVKAVSFSCLLKGQKQSFTTVFQWITFGSGCSFVAKDSLKDCEFNMGYEFGFGEDGDFGMQLRNKGCDVLYLPHPEILHLKAPMGGFRTKPVLQWQNDKIQPKPSPTIMLYQLLHHSAAQRNSYKTTLFFKYYRLQSIKNPFKYFAHFQKQWDRSVFWANELRKQNEI